jgi:hypothetical protein
MCFFLLRLTKQSFEIKYKPLAEVAELADALGSGLSGRKLVRVQVPPSALPMVARQRLAERRVFCFPTIPIFNGKSHGYHINGAVTRWYNQLIHSVLFI